MPPLPSPTKTSCPSESLSNASVTQRPSGAEAFPLGVTATGRSPRVWRSSRRMAMRSSSVSQSRSQSTKRLSPLEVGQACRTVRPAETISQLHAARPRLASGAEGAAIVAGGLAAIGAPAVAAPTHRPVALRALGAAVGRQRIPAALAEVCFVRFVDILPTAKAGGFPSQTRLQKNFRPVGKGLTLHQAANAALHVLGGAPARLVQSAA